MEQQNFFNKLSSLIKKTPENQQIRLTTDDKSNLSPLAQTAFSTPATVYDVEKERLEVKPKDIAQLGIELGREIFTKPIPRMILEARKAVAPPSEKKKFEQYVPKTVPEQIIFGKEPIEPYSTTVAKWRQWIEEQTGLKLPRALDVPAVFLLGALDIPPFGVAKNVVKGIIKKFGKEIGEEIIKRGPEFAERALKAEGEEIPKIIEEIKKDLSAVGKTKEVVQQVRVPPKPFEGFKDITSKFLNYLKGKTFVGKQEILDFARRQDISRAEAELLQKLADEMKDKKIPATEFAEQLYKELLPLKTVKIKKPGFFPYTIEGKVARGMPVNAVKKLAEESGYEEVIFEWPYRTYYPSTHYKNSYNYFAHARGTRTIENGKKIWQEQEIQSDLLNRDEEQIKDIIGWAIAEWERPIALSENFVDVVNYRYNLLKPFRNDRYGERILRHRIKEKASQGYDKYRLPTPETIAKIQGFEKISPWELHYLEYFWLPEEEKVIRGGSKKLLEKDLEVGKIIHNPTSQKDYVIVDILDNGQFRVAPLLEMHYMIRQELGPEQASLLLESNYLEEAKKLLKHFIETHPEIKESFPVASVYDVWNPVAHRYKKWGEYLQKKFGAKIVVDKNGNTWYEVDLKPEYAKMPVEAFGAFAGVEYDEQTGELKFSPEKAILGIAGIGISKNISDQIFKKFGKDLGKRILREGPEFIQKALKAEGEELKKLIESIKPETRRFTERLQGLIKKETPELAEKLEQRIVEKPQILFRDVHHDKELIENAKKLIKENPELAKNKVIYEPPSDENFVLGMQLIKELSTAGRNEEAIQIIEALAPKTTETGRALRSLQLYSRLTPEGFLLHAQRKLEKISENLTGVDKFLSKVLKTRARLEPEDIKFIRETMEKAQRATSEIEKLRLTRQAIQRVEEKMPWTLKRIFYELWNLPRSFMAGLGDMSAVLRQNWLYSLSHPIETSKKIWGYYVKPMLSEENAEKIIEEIYTHPNFPLMEKAKIAFTDLDSNLLMREEQFRSVLAEKIPGIGPLIRATGRGYTAFLNKMRFDIANDLIENLVKPALEYGEKEKAEKLLKSIGKWVNTATGRGDIGALGIVSSELSQVLFAPKFLKASFDLINPFYYASLEPEVRKEALKNVLRALGAGLTILSIAKLWGAEVGDNPDSVDFGKIKIGHTRINVFGPFQRWAVLFSRLLSGKYVSSVTGREYELGVGFRPLTRQDLLTRFFEPKLHPSLNFLLNALEGRRFTGERFEFPGAFIDLFIPIVIQDMNDLIEEHGPIGLLGVPLSVLGLDVQTYGNLGNYVPYLRVLPGGGVGVETRPVSSLGYKLSELLLGERLQPTEIPIADEQRKMAIWQSELDKEKTYLSMRKSEIKRRYLNGEIDYDTAYSELYRIYNDSLERMRKLWETELQIPEPFPLDLMSQQLSEALLKNE